MSTTIGILNYTISGLLSLLFIYRVYQLIIGNKIIKKAIENELNTGKDNIQTISKLSLTEKMRYGVPISIFAFYNYFFGIVSGKIEYSRKIKLKDNDKDIIKYVAVSVKNRKVTGIKQFDSYTL